MIEKIPVAEKSGKIYENVKQLADEIRTFREKNRGNIGGKADGSADILVLRIFGKQMAKYEKEDKREYWQMEDAGDKSFVAASIHKEDDYRVALNINDYRQWAASGGKARPELIYWMTLDKNNIKNYRLQVALKKIKLNMEK